MQNGLKYVYYNLYGIRFTIFRLLNNLHCKNLYLIVWDILTLNFLF